MKVAVVGPAYPFRGGIAHYTTLLAAHLSAQHDTRLYSFERQYPAVLFPGRSQIDPSEKPLADVETRRWLTPWWPFSWRRVTGLESLAARSGGGAMVGAVHGADDGVAADAARQLGITQR